MRLLRNLLCFLYRDNSVDNQFIVIKSTYRTKHYSSTSSICSTWCKKLLIKQLVCLKVVVIILIHFKSNNVLFVPVEQVKSSLFLTVFYEKLILWISKMRIFFMGLTS